MKKHLSKTIVTLLIALFFVLGTNSFSVSVKAAESEITKITLKVDKSKYPALVEGDYARDISEGEFAILHENFPIKYVKIQSVLPSIDLFDSTRSIYTNIPVIINSDGTGYDNDKNQDDYIIQKGDKYGIYIYLQPNVLCHFADDLNIISADGLTIKFNSSHELVEGIIYLGTVGEEPPGGNSSNSSGSSGPHRLTTEEIAYIQAMMNMSYSGVFPGISPETIPQLLAGVPLEDLNRIFAGMPPEVINSMLAGTYPVSNSAQAQTYPKTSPNTGENNSSYVFAMISALLLVLGFSVKKRYDF